MKTKILSGLVEVEARLDGLGFRREKVLSVVEAMVSARNSRTENDPVCSGGLLSWIMGTRRLREELLREGWERDNSNQVPTVLNAQHGLRIAVINSDDGTGISDRVPQPRSKKGAATDHAVASNQTVFSDIMDAAIVPFSGQRDDGVVQWYLFVYSEGEAVRAELSCPVGYADGGFTEFQERILVLVDGATGTPDPVRKITPDDDSGFEIPVIRKAL